MDFGFRKIKIVKSEIRKIGPKEAESMLEKNLDNRKLRPAIVNEYAMYMKSDLWVENGETVLVTKDGYLLNGQHRLYAVIASGVTINFLIAIVEPVDGKGRLTPIGVLQDRGSQRNHADINNMPSKADKIASMMIRHFMNRGAVFSKNTAMRAAIYDVFEDHIDYLTNKCGNSRRYVSRASIQAIFVLRLAQGFDYTDRYKIILTNMVGLPESWMSWYRQVESIQHNDSSARDRVLALTTALTDPHKKDDRKIVVHRESEKKYIESMKDLFHYYALDTIKKVVPDYEFVK